MMQRLGCHETQATKQQTLSFLISLLTIRAKPYTQKLIPSSGSFACGDRQALQLWDVENGRLIGSDFPIHGFHGWAPMGKKSGCIGCPCSAQRCIGTLPRSLSKSEKNCAQLTAMKKEALSLIFEVSLLYLLGCKFTLTTDHKLLMTILGPNTGFHHLIVTQKLLCAILHHVWDDCMPRLRTKTRVLRAKLHGLCVHVWGCESVFYQLESFCILLCPLPPQNRLLRVVSCVSSLPVPRQKCHASRLQQGTLTILPLWTATTSYSYTLSCTIDLIVWACSVHDHIATFIFLIGMKPHNRELAKSYVYMYGSYILF